MKIPKRVKIIGTICKRGASGHSNRPEVYGINLVWECNRALLEDRKNLSCHPLDRNRLQIQIDQGLGERTVGIRCINWEAEMPGIESLESLKVWEDIYRAPHPFGFGQPDGECRERAEDMKAIWLHKLENSITVTRAHVSKARGGSCFDCNHE